MNEMVERVARAICEDRCLMAEYQNNPCIDAETKRDAPCRATADFLILTGTVDTAERVIKAMREPTEAMLDAARQNDFPHDVASTGEKWRFMIDAALSEEKQPA